MSLAAFCFALLTLLLLFHCQNAVIDEWERSLFSHDSLDLKLAHSLISDPHQGPILCKHKFRNGQHKIPTIHYMLNLYFRSANPMIRSSLTNLMIRCIKLGSNVRDPFNLDPSVLFKSLMMREMMLAKAIADASTQPHNLDSPTQDLATRQTFIQLYSIPCELVPLSKLLLHASTIVGSRGGMAGMKDVESIKSLIAGAALGGQSKPAVKGSDLSMSPHYTELLSNGFGSVDFRLHLRDLMRVLQEAAGAVHSALLLGSGDSSSFNAAIPALVERDQATNRSALHYLAISGSALLINQLTDRLTSAIISKSKLELTSVGDALLAPDRLGMIVGDALLAPDRLGMIPSSYTMMRFGEESDAYLAMLDLCKTVSLSTFDGCKGWRAQTMFPQGIKRSKRASADIESAGDTEIVAIQVEAGGAEGLSVTTPTTTASESDIRGSHGLATGGWSTERLSPSIAGDTSRCDIVEEHALPPTALEFYYKYVQTNTPVIFRGAAISSHIQEVMSKIPFLNRYDNFLVEAASIPYPGSFGKRGERMTLKDVTALQSAAHGDEDSVNRTAPSYTFTTPSPQWRDRLLSDCPLPGFIPTDISALSSAAPDSSSDSSSPANVEIQFYLGPAGSGAPVHFHGHAVNTLAYGEKKWFLYQPADAFYSTLPSLEFARESGERRSSEALVCTQRSGDIMFVPTLWGHGTLNVQQSIGVAHEFSIEPFCME